MVNQASFEAKAKGGQPEFVSFQQLITDIMDTCNLVATSHTLFFLQLPALFWGVLRELNYLKETVLNRAREYLMWNINFIIGCHCHYH